MRYSLFVWTFSIQFIYAELQNCGILREKQVYTEDLQVAENEFPWFGRIIFEDKRSRDRKFLCTSVLITKRHLLSPAHCFLQTIVNDKYTVEFVQLGYSFDDEYLIHSIIIHPNANRNNMLYDISIIQLSRMITLSEFIEPICLPPPNTYTSILAAQYLVVGGFPKFDVSENYTLIEKTKSVAHVMSAKRCPRTEANFHNVNGLICVSTPTNHIYLSGSALMGIEVDQNTDLKFYYLIGILNYAFYEDIAVNKVITFSINVGSHINWINSNINNINIEKN